MKKIILLVFLLSSCSFVDDKKIQDNNVDIKTFLGNQENISTGAINNYDDIENITIDNENINTDNSGSIEDSVIENTTEKDVEELIDILIKSGN